MALGDTLNRIRVNWKSGALDSTIDAVATGLSSVQFADLPEVTAPNNLPLVLDKDEEFGVPEIVWVTSHVADATTVVVLRGQEGTVARGHQAATTWVHGLTAFDMEDTSDLYAQQEVDFDAHVVDFDAHVGDYDALNASYTQHVIDAAQALSDHEAYADVTFLKLAGGTLVGSVGVATDDAINLGSSTLAFNSVFALRLRSTIIREVVSGANVFHFDAGIRDLFGPSGSAVLSVLDDGINVHGYPVRNATAETPVTLRDDGAGKVYYTLAAGIVTLVAEWHSSAGQTLTTLPAAIRPVSGDLWFAGAWVSSSGVPYSDKVVDIRVRANGALFMATPSSIPVDETARITCTYAVGSKGLT